MSPADNKLCAQRHTRIKICGLGRMEDVGRANRLLPDYVGFVFAQSRRRVTPAVARSLIQGLDPRIAAVGVFVDETVDQVAWTAEACGLRVVQLHGGESEDALRALRERLPSEILVWKALRIKQAQDVTRFVALSGSRLADGWLLDAWHPDQVGGTGEVFDWDLLRTVEAPYLLAGGLTPHNAGLAIRQLHPWGVDVSSGVETGGRKDGELMTAFVRAVREADREKG